jgi:hypothetical protein
MRLFACLVAMGVVLAESSALALAAANVSAMTNKPPALTGESDEKAWPFSTSAYTAYTCFVPDDRD